MSDARKPRPSLLPPDALLAVVRVLEYGAAKDGRKPGDWQHLGPEGVGMMVDAALRHLLEHAAGREQDESGELHLAHAAASCLLAVALVTAAE